MANVPNVPGVPPLPNYGANNIELLAADLISTFGSLFGSPWGVFLNGFPVIEADNTVSFELKQDSPISDYQVEPNGFQSYDKIQLPSEIRVQMSAGGDDTNRQNFLESIAAVMNTVDLYDVVTPEEVYQSYNFTHRDFRRSAQNGVGLITVDLWLKEVRVSSTATFQNTQQPGDAGQKGGGNVQPQTPSQAVQADVSGQVR